MFFTGLPFTPLPSPFLSAAPLGLGSQGGTSGGADRLARARAPWSEIAGVGGEGLGRFWGREEKGKWGGRGFLLLFWLMLWDLWNVFVLFGYFSCICEMIVCCLCCDFW